MTSPRFLPLALGGIMSLTLCQMPVQAQTPPSARSVAPETPPTPTQAAERYLKDGRRYIRAISLLTDAAAKSPDASTYRLLGMAYAARYASLGFARHQAAQYEFARRDWERRRDRRAKAEADNDPNAEDIVVPRAPDPPVTPDDSKPFALAPEQSKSEMITLGNQCLKAFEQARMRGASGDDRTLTENACGWTILLLQRMGKGVVTYTQTRPEGARKTDPRGTVPSLEIYDGDAATCFEQCVKAAPKNANFWQALAIARAPRRLMPRAFGANLIDDGSRRPTDAPDDPKAASDTAWQVACSLYPHDWQLSYQRGVYRLVDNIPGAVQSFGDAARRNPTNAALWYFLVAARLRLPDANAADPETVLHSIEAGNATPVYVPLAFTLPAPLPLRKAWALEPVSGYGEGALFFEYTMQFLSDELKKDIAGKQEKRALRLAVASLLAGVKVSSSIGAEDLNLRYEGQEQGRVRAMFGAVLAEQAYVWIRRDQAAHPSDAKAASLDRYQTLFERMQQLEKTTANID